MKLQDQIAINNMRLEGHSPSEIAAKLGLSPSTVRSHIHRHRHIPILQYFKNRLHLVKYTLIESKS